MPGASRSTPVVPTPPCAPAMPSTASAVAAAARAGVAAHVHGGRSRVRGLTAEREAVSLHPGRSAHRGHGHALPVEHRALLDVQLQVGAGGPRGAAAAPAMEPRSTPCSASAVAMATPPASLRPSRDVGIERPGHGRAAEEAAPEARPLLVGEVHQGHAVGRALVRGHAQHLQRRHHAEGAVEPAAPGHGVDVRSHGDAPLTLARQPGPEVGRLVALHRHPVDGREAAAQEVPGLLPLRGPAHPARAAGAAGQAVELPEVRDDPPGVDRHQPTRSRRMACIRQCAPPPPSVKADSSGS